jgi:hypothetical protein
MEKARTQSSVRREKETSTLIQSIDKKVQLKKFENQNHEMNVNFDSKIFWPVHCNRAQSGFLIGWNIRNFNGCVASVISDVQAREDGFFPEFECDSTYLFLNSSIAQLPVIEVALRTLASDPELANLWQYCKGPPIVLGWWQTNDSQPISVEMQDDIGSIVCFVFFSCITLFSICFRDSILR